MDRSHATIWGAAVAAVAAGTLSLGRLLMTAPDALQTLVWAEDGLFPLCVRGHGLWPCLVEPYSGYLLALPRLVAWPVSVFPLGMWPLATNVAAAVLAAGLALITLLVLRAGGVGIVVSVLVACLPTLAPISGFEAINVTASVYMPLLFLGALAVSIPPTSRLPVVPYCLGAAAVTLTIPSSAVLLPILLVQTLRRRIPVRAAGIIGAVAIAGLALQLWAAKTAANPRSLQWSGEGLRQWLDSVPLALLSFVPGQVELDPSGALAATSWGHMGVLGVVFVLGVTVIAASMAFLRDRTLSGVGMAVLAGLLLGVLPAAAGFANNRYLVMPVLLLLAGSLIAIDRLAGARWRPLVPVAAALMVVACIPGLAASKTRGTAVPPWPQMIEAARSACIEKPEAPVSVMFTPSWPFVDAVFSGPTSNVLRCSEL